MFASEPSRAGVCPGVVTCVVADVDACLLGSAAECYLGAAGANSRQFSTGAHRHFVGTRSVYEISKPLSGRSKRFTAIENHLLLGAYTASTKGRRSLV